MATGTPSVQALATPIRYRRNAARLTTGQRADFREAFAASQAVADDRGYGHWAGIHGLPLPIGCDAAHGTPYFLPWHRAYLYFFERTLRDRVASVSLAWWDWRTPTGRSGHLPPAYQDETGQPNPLFSAAVDPVALQQGGNRVGAQTRRNEGSAGAPPLPSAQEVAAVLRIRDFETFTGTLEGLHNRVHMWVGGHMGQIPYAAFDPIFWAHHTMVDRVWRQWQLRYPGARPPAGILDDALPPFRMTVRQTLDVTALGYDYAVASASQAAKG